MGLDGRALARRLVSDEGAGWESTYSQSQTVRATKVMQSATCHKTLACKTQMNHRIPESLIKR